MSNLAVYYWIRNNQNGCTQLRHTYNSNTGKHYYFASVIVNGYGKFVRITRDEYDTINDRHGNTRDCFRTKNRLGRFTTHEHSVRMRV